jgi:hypothetical protein
MRSRGVSTCLLIAVATTMIVGCGPQQVGNPHEAESFVTAIAKGGKLSDWKLAETPDQKAISAWQLV